jgi:hypothetical protein
MAVLCSLSSARRALGRLGDLMAAEPRTQVGPGAVPPRRQLSSRLDGMTQHKSVNDCIDGLADMPGSPVEVEGVLNTTVAGHLGTREHWLLHYPKAERRPDASGNPSAPRSRLLLEFGDGSIRPNLEALARWKDKRVRVHGIVRPAKTPMALSDASSAYYTHLEVYSIQRVTSNQRREDA